MTDIIAVTGWEQRLAIITGLSLSDEQAVTSFNVNQQELDDARNTLDADASFDIEPYRPMFPTTATKKSKPPRSQKIVIAFNNVPDGVDNAMVYEEFTRLYPVSLNVLRQGKRFDKSGKAGRVRIRKPKGMESVMIWRDIPE